MPTSSSKAATLRSPITSASTSQKNCRDWSDSTARIYLFDVELDHERNRRQRKNCQHVEITARGRGPVVRGEACADSFYAALESAVCKLENRLRRSKDRRKIHYGDKTPVSLAEATAAVARCPTIDAVARRTDAPTAWRSTTTNRAGSCAPRNTRPSR